MAQLRDLVPNYAELLGQGVSQDEVLTLARQRAVTQKQPHVAQPAQTPPQQSGLRGYIMESDAVPAQVARGLASNAARFGNMVTGAMDKPTQTPSYYSGMTPTTTFNNAPLVKLGEQLDAKKEQVSKQGLYDKERLDVKEALAKEAQNAQGIGENLVVGAKQMWDVATNPKEWTAQGVTEFASDPLNMATFGFGALAGKIAKGPLSAVFFGAGAGVTENSAITAGTEYLIARGEGKSVEEAKKIATQAAAGGAIAGGALGGAGGGVGYAMDARAAPQAPQSKEGGETPQAPKNSSAEASMDDLLAGIEAEVRAAEDEVVIATTVDALVAQGADPQTIAQAVESAVKVTDDDVRITHVLNSGADLPPSYSGARVAVKVRNTVEAGQMGPDEVYARLKEKGASDELAAKAAEAVRAGDPEIFNAWYKTKMDEASDQNVEAVRQLENPEPMEAPQGETIVEVVPEVLEGQDATTNLKNDIHSLDRTETAKLYENMESPEIEYDLSFGKGEVRVIKGKVLDEKYQDLKEGYVRVLTQQGLIEYVQTDKIRQSQQQSPVRSEPIVKEGKLMDDVTGVREDVEYVLLPPEAITTEFQAGEGYQFRSNKQDSVIRDIANEFDADRHFGNDGGFDGVPVVDSQGRVLVGNHRAEGIKKLSPEARARYQEGLKRYYGVEGEGMLVRRLKDDAAAKRVAKVSNDRRVRADSEKMVLDEAKYDAKVDALPERVGSEAELKGLLGAMDEVESNRAVLARVGSPELPYAIDRYMKQNPLDLNFKQMFYKNAFRLHNIAKQATKAGYEALNIGPLLDRAIDRMVVAKGNKGQGLGDVVNYYTEMLKLGGRDIEGRAITPEDFAADIMGVALRHYRTLKDDGIVEFGRRLENAEAEVKGAKQPNLFGEAQPEPSIMDVALSLLSESDRARMDIQQIKQRMEANEQATRTRTRADEPGATNSADASPRGADGADGIPARGDNGVSEPSTRAVGGDESRGALAGDAMDSTQRPQGDAQLGDTTRPDGRSVDRSGERPARVDTKEDAVRTSGKTTQARFEVPPTRTQKTKLKAAGFTYDAKSKTYKSTKPEAKKAAEEVLGQQRQVAFDKTTKKMMEC